MAEKKTLSFVLMDAPFENERTVTAFRLIDAAIRRGHDVNVFAYEGAVSLSFAKQAQHPNPVHGRATAEEEDHPLPREWIVALFGAAEKAGVKLDWINCGMCVDERGAGESAPCPSRGSPADLWKGAEASVNTLVIGTR